MKFKTKIKDGRLFVQIKSNRTINLRELNLISQKNIRGVLRPYKIDKSKVVYAGPVSISMTERIKKPISKYEFFYIMLQIARVISAVEGNQLSPQNIIFDLRYVYINEHTKEMQFIYAPLAENGYQNSALNFMEAIIYLSTAEQNQNTDYIARFHCFIKEMTVFNADAICNYIGFEEPSMKKQARNVSGYMTDKPRDYYQHYNQERNVSTNAASSFAEENTALLSNEDEGTAYLEDFDEATGLLNEDDTTLLVENANVHFPSLNNVNTGEVISVNKPVFRIGKEKSYVDYFVANNNAVSRSHADIITRGNKYFIMDLNSKNHTYVDGQMIPIRCEVEIFEGSKIRIANEEFIFHV